MRPCEDQQNMTGRRQPASFGRGCLRPDSSYELLFLCIRSITAGSHNLQSAHNPFYRRQSDKDNGKNGFRKNIAQIIKGRCPDSSHISAEISHIGSIENKTGNFMEQEPACNTYQITLQKSML